jgi:hypothetical protein
MITINEPPETEEVIKEWLQDKGYVYTTEHCIGEHCPCLEGGKCPEPGDYLEPDELPPNK